MFKYLLVFCFFSFFQISTFLSLGQGTIPGMDTTINSDIANLGKIYDQTIKKNSFLYSGRVYYGVSREIREHQYFLEESWALGNLTYQGESFDSLYLMYDIYNDLILLQSYTDNNKPAPIILNVSDITAFYILGHSFVYLKLNKDSEITEGLYDELFNGSKTKLYSKREKIIKKYSEGNLIWDGFSENDKYYLFKDGVYYKVGNKKSLLSILADQKKTLKKFIRDYDINYWQDFENAALKVIKYYETLQV